MSHNLTYAIRTMNATNKLGATPGEQLSADDMLFILNARFYIYGYVVLPLALVGLALNSFTILVLLHPKMRYFSTNAYLTTLSMANIFCLTNFVFLFSLRYLLTYDLFKANLDGMPKSGELYAGHSYENFINLILGIATPVSTTFQLYSIYLTCAVTVDRWIYITFPLKVDTICSMRNTFIAIGTIFVFCFIYNLPRWFELEYTKLNIDNSTTFYQAQLTEIGRNKLFHQIMRRYGYFVFVYAVPFFILIVVNIGIVKKLIETKRRKRDLLIGAASANPLLLESTAAAPNGGNGSNSSRRGSNSHSSCGGKRSNQNHNNNNNNSNHLGGSYSTNNGGSTSHFSRTKSVKILRSSLGSSIKLDPRITLMIVAIVLAFFLCQFPYLMVNILFSNMYENTTWFHIVKIGCDLLTVISYCINFLIYCFFGQNFREIAAFMLCHPSLHPYNQTKLLRALSNKRRSQAMISTSAAAGAGLGVGGTVTAGGGATGGGGNNACTNSIYGRQSSFAQNNIHQQVSLTASPNVSINRFESR